MTEQVLTKTKRQALHSKVNPEDLQIIVRNYEQLMNDVMIDCIGNENKNEPAKILSDKILNDFAQLFISELSNDKDKDWNDKMAKLKKEMT